MDSARGVAAGRGPPSGGNWTHLGGYNANRQPGSASHPISVSRQFSYITTHDLYATSFTPSPSRVDSLFRTSFRLDSLGRIVERYRFPLAGGADTIRSFLYDRAGQLIQYTDRVGGTRSCHFEVDVGQVCTVSGASIVANVPYDYDLVGNRTGGTINPGSRLASWQDYTFTYDADGNLIRKVLDGAVDDSLQWNALGELVSVFRDGVMAATFQYDGFGRRVSKQTAGGTTFYQWDGDHVVADRNAAGAILVEYGFYPGMDHPNSVTARDTTFYAATEGPGNVSGLFMNSSGPFSVYRYRPFGEFEQNDLSRPNALRFQGRPYDPETGLYYFRARYYDPVVGRFISEDPIGLEGGINPYVFAGNDPVNGQDPTGTCPEGQPSKTVFKHVDDNEWITHQECLTRDGWRVDTSTGIRVWSGRNVFAMLGALGRAMNSFGDWVGINSLGRGADDIARGNYVRGGTTLAMAIPVGGGASRAGLRLAEGVGFKTGHAARHLVGTGLNSTTVEEAIRYNILGRAMGNHYGWVTVGGQWIQYRAFAMSPGIFNVGTYFPVTRLFGR